MPEQNSIKIKLEAGKKYSLCTCGGSKCLPFCDDEHKKLNEQGHSYKSIKITPKQNVEIEVSCSNWPEESIS